MLERGETFGVFQLESGGMTRYVQELRPDLHQGPRRDGRPLPPGPDAAHPHLHSPPSTVSRRAVYPHPDLSEVLDETYGVIVYQDQVLLIAQKFAGYSLGQADVMRKAMGKKVRAMMRAEEERFLSALPARATHPSSRSRYTT